MKTVSIRDLHIHASGLVREAADCTVIVIEHGGEAVAELRFLSKKPAKPPLPDLTDFWESFPMVPGDSGRFLEDRQK